MDFSVSLLISAIVGAGVFALPSLAREAGMLSLLIVPAAFLYMLGVGHLIIEMFPGTVEEEVERELGEWGKHALVFVERAVILLALVAYALALRLHLGLSSLMVLALLAIPLLLELHPTSQITTTLAFFTLGFVSFLSLLALPRMELPYSVADAVSAIDWKAGIPLFLAAIFAFYGHNMIPRVRNILRSEQKTRRAVYLALSVVFMLYLAFAVSVSGLKVTGLATTFLSGYAGGNMGVLIDLSAAIIFYASFIVMGLHLSLNMGKGGSAFVFAGTAALYGLAVAAGAGFADIVAAAGLGVSIYGGLIGLAASRKRIREGYAVLSASAAVWVILLFQFFWA